MQTTAAINVATDVVLLIFPLPLLPLLKFNKKQRAALAFILSIGLVPVVASTMRMCEIIMAGSPTSLGSSWQEADSSWYESSARTSWSSLIGTVRTWAWVPVWSQIEVDVGIVAASLPSLSPLLKQVWTVFPTTGRSSTPSQLPDFPQYRDSLIREPLSKEMVIDVEKSMKVSEAGYYNELSDVDEEIGVARTANIKIVRNGRLGR